MRGARPHERAVLADAAHPPREIAAASCRPSQGRSDRRDGHRGGADVRLNRRPVLRASAVRLAPGAPKPRSAIPRRPGSAAALLRPHCTPDSPAVTSARARSRRRGGTGYRAAGVKFSMSCMPCSNAERTAMPAVQPLHLPLVERRVDRLRRERVRPAERRAGWPTTATARLGVDALVEHVTTPRAQDLRPRRHCPARLLQRMRCGDNRRRRLHALSSATDNFSASIPSTRSR